MDFQNAGKWTKALLERQLSEGMTAVDATMGNGHDTEFLCSMVGETGRVYAFDIQREALENTGARLEGAGFSSRATLILASHERMGEFVPCLADCIVFNLGWLPGQKHTVTTRSETTLAAVSRALDLLKVGGLMTICVYPGHEEGTRELEALHDWAAKLDDRIYDAYTQGYINLTAKPPILIAVAKKK